MKRIQQEIRQLPLEDMLVLREHLVASIHEKEDTQQLDPAFRDEIQRRVKEVDSGKAEGVDAFEALKEMWMPPQSKAAKLHAEARAEFARLTNCSSRAGILAHPRPAAACRPHLPCLALAVAVALAAFALGCSARSGASKAAVTEPRTYTNPVYSGSMPDPSVIRYKGFYYAFGTTGHARTPDGRIFTTLRSRNLVEWETVGGALVPPSPNGRVQYWAPEVTFHQGTFYLYYAMGGIETENFELRIATSRRPEGPYIDTGSKLVDCETNRFTIDPYPFRDDDGQWYFFYARNFTNSEPGVHPGTAIVVDRLLDMTRLAGDCHVVLRARYDWTLYEANRRMDVYHATFDWHTIEGPCVVKHDGRYYCFYSGANYQTARYGVDYVVADHPLGPYTKQGDQARVLHSVSGKVRGPGHHSIVPSPDGRAQYLVYHAWDPAMQVRWMCLDKLLWTPDGPRCAGPTWTPQPTP